MTYLTKIVWSRGQVFSIRGAIVLLSAKPLKLTKGQKMTRKDYEAIAKAISAVRQYSYLSGDLNFQAGIDQVTGAISQVLIEDNPLFDRQRFIAATMERQVA